MTKKTRIKRSITLREALFCRLFGGLIVNEVKITTSEGCFDTTEIQPQQLGFFIGYLMRSEIPYSFEESRREGHLRLDFKIEETDSIGSITFPSNMPIGEVNRRLEELLSPRMHLYLK